MNSLALRMQHTSLQYSDSFLQQRHDVRALFEIGHRFPIKTGTEAGQTKNVENANRKLLTDMAHAHNHAINFAGDTWVAVDRTIVAPNSLRLGDVPLVLRSEHEGIGGNRSMPTIAFDHINPYVGRINVGAIHLYTDGRKPGDPNYEANVKASKKVNSYLSDVARGSALGFVNGDFNIPDNRLDVALGEHYTSMGDALNHWPDTGHGPIDAMCSFDQDGRVTAHRWDVLDDIEKHMFSDHYICQGTWRIRLLEEKA